MKKILAILLTVAALISVVGCTPAVNTTTADPNSSAGSSEPEGTTSTEGYLVDAERNEVIINDAGEVTVKNEGNARVFYQIFVGSFSDSNGDGIGDLRGIIDRFDYLNDGDDNSGLSLGVEGIWLSPIFVSPTYHKYDVTDYYRIDPQFGTEEDLKELADLCESRNVKLILDLVLNHTAKNHQWFNYFVNAHKAGDTDSMYYDYYTYADKPQAGRTFLSIPGTKHYYECNFSGDMPELNFDNENVRMEAVEIARYYLEEVGVDGFRFDAAKYIYYGDDVKSAQFWDWYLGELRKIKPDIYTVAEVWSGDGATYPYFSSTNCFNFSMAQSEGLIASTAKGSNAANLAKYVEKYLGEIRQKNPDAMIVSFIANHDTDRAAGFLPVTMGRGYVAASLNILMPGSPFIYYGEEIGMKGSRGGANTDANRRLAMLWGDGDTVKDPVGTTYKKDSQTNGTVADQLPVSVSLYNHYKKLIQIRKANPEIAYGDYKALEIEGSDLGGFISTLEGSSVVVLHNTTTEGVQIDISAIPELADRVLTAVAGVNGAYLKDNTLYVGAQTSIVLR